MSDSAYWDLRQDLVYYHVVRVLAQGLVPSHATVLDVGSANCPHLEWFPHASRRVSVDLTAPYVAEGVESYALDFLDWEVPEKFQLVTCLQVLEHIPDAGAFAQKLLACAKRLVISVPYMWRAGATKTHVQDPVDDAKLLGWFGRAPNYQYLCQEVITDQARLVQVYDMFAEPWRSLTERRAIINAMRAKRAERAASGSANDS